MIGQADFDAMAEQIQEAMGGLFESVMYIHRANASDTPVTYGPVDAMFDEYQEGIFTASALVASEQSRVLRGDREVTIATAQVTWTPSIHGRIVRGNGETWRICPYEGAIRGGAGDCWYFFHVRLQR
jgi:hypothetical protein